MLRLVPTAGDVPVLTRHPLERGADLGRTGADGPGEGRLVPGPVRHGSIVLKRGVSRDRKLEDWWQAVVRGEDARRNGAIVLMDDRREDVLRWNFVRAWPAAFAASGLDGKGREVVIETLELVHEGLRAEPCTPSRRPEAAGTGTAVPVDPSHGTGRKPWP